MLTAGIDGFPEGDRAAVPELSRPASELVSTVAGRHRVHAREQAVAAEHLRELFALQKGRLEIEQRRNFSGDGQRAWALHRRGSNAGKAGSEDLPWPNFLARVDRETLQRAVVESQHETGPRVVA